MTENSRDDARRIAKELNWREGDTNKKGYLKMVCPCGQHLKWLHKTPSDPDYFKNQIADFRRKGCSGDPS